MLIQDLRIFQWVRQIGRGKQKPVQIVGLRSADYSICAGIDPYHLVTCIDEGVYYDYTLDELEPISEEEEAKIVLELIK